MSEAKPTPGEWLLELAPNGGWCIFVGPSLDMDVHRTIASRGQWPLNIAESHANAVLFHDAGTVFNTTGLTPSQLVERVKELERALMVAVNQNEHDMLMTGEELRAARAALSKARPNTAEGEAAQTAPASFAVAEPWWKSEDIEVTLYPPISTSGLQIGMPKGVKVMHKPTGLFATSEDERSQYQNRDVALGKLQELLATAPTPAAAKEPSP